ncbi:glycine-rich domain-containing protein [Allorhizobium undicola]|uniref:glycine-rich domain-containing protein n=1 Tax=Allorhizobium undicola TaxID=78527 RepID=UPI0004873F49|nr:hypothetical protein [Allorhizobium undicola]
MVALPYPSPRRSAGGGASRVPISARILHYDADGLDHLKITTSLSTTTADLIAQILAPEPALDPRQVEIDIMVIGGGGQGAVGETAYGGLPGCVCRRKQWLSELAKAGDVYIDIGAGGDDPSSASWVAGNVSSFRVNFVDGSSFYVDAVGGAGGTLDAHQHQQNYRQMVGYGATYADPSADLDGISNPFGPGGGGNIADSTAGMGGWASRADANYSLPGANTPGGYAQDAFANWFLQFGGGGAGAIETSETPPRGGLPGGGGGAAVPGVTPGPGANGEVRIQTTVWETF